MTRQRLIRIAAATSVLGLLVPAAAFGGDVATTFTVTQGSDGLSIDVASGTADLGETPATFSTAGSVSGSLPATTVTDARGSLLASWSVQVEAVETAIQRTGDDGSVPLSEARVYFDQATVDGLVTSLGGALAGMTVTDAQLTDGTASLAGPYALITGTTNDLGLGVAPNVTYTPSMGVGIPAGTPAGDYSVTVRQTVSGS